MTPQEPVRHARSSTPAVALVAVVMLLGIIGGFWLSRKGHAPVATTVASTPGVLATPSPMALPGAQHASLSAPSTNVVWILVADRYLYRSTDRSATWQQRPLPPSSWPSPGAEISFVSDHEGWLKTGETPPTYPYCSAERIAIWHTIDAGSTWQQLVKQGSLAIPATSSSPYGIQGLRCKQRLSFADSNVGVLGTDDPNRAPIIYRTADGGQNWTPSDTLPDPPGFREAGGFTMRIGSIRSFGSTFVLTASDMVSVEYVFQSTDRGATWKYVSGNSETPLTTLVTPSTWIRLYPGDRQSAESFDAGNTWNIVSSDYPGSDYPGPVFADSLVGYANVGAGLLKTADGGFHWVPIVTPWTAKSTP